MITRLFYIAVLSGSLLFAARPGSAQDVLTSAAGAADVAGAAPAPAVNAPQQPDLTKLGIEDLMKIQVTTASKRAQPLNTIPAAVYVVTQEDIRRAGATNIPDALRLVPGVQVTQVDSHTYAITIRGFNDQFAGKLLVLIDGRSVYTPAFSGVWWDAQDVMMEDVDRIEVIRGPGGSLWGANAVDGIINIITKNAHDTQGGLVAVTAGNKLSGLGSLRYGGKFGHDGAFRVYAKNEVHGHTLNPDGTDAGDSWDHTQTGMRMDWGDAARAGKFTLQGDYYNNHKATNAKMLQLTPPYMTSIPVRLPVSGWNVLGKWERSFKNGAGQALQIYFDKATRKIGLGLETSTLNTFDVDLQNQHPLDRRNSLIWGLGYRHVENLFTNTWTFSYTSPARQDIFSGFAQNETEIRKDLHLTLGLKLEHNNFTGLEVQPNARIAWTPDPHRTLWASVARAVRTPSITDRGINIKFAVFPGDGGKLMVPALLGTPDHGPDTLIAYELGYRREVSERFTFDLAAFYNFYDHLSTEPDGTPFLETNPAPAHLILPTYKTEAGRGRTYGGEISARWRPTENWRLDLGYSLLAADLHGEGVNPLASPHHQFQVRSQLDLPHHFEVDTMVYWYDKIVDLDPQVNAYTRVDLRLGWHPSKNLELSIQGNNLTASKHYEFQRNAGGPSNLIERSFFGKATWNF